MTVCNMLIHGCVGEVICHDSLNPGNFVDGWKVNPMLAWTGIPTIKRMNMKEYRAGRNLPASPYILRKTMPAGSRKHKTDSLLPLQAVFKM